MRYFRVKINIFASIIGILMRKFIQITSLFFLLCSCSGQETFVLIRGYAQGGIYNVKCSSGDIAPEQLKTGIDSILNVIDSSVSGYNPESLLSKYNAGQAIPQHPQEQRQVFDRLTQYGDIFYDKTEGAVDTRAAALYDIWGFGFKQGQMPSTQEVESAKEDRNKLNFNAIAQGFSSDEVAAYLRKHGVKNMLVDIGGEFYCCGHNPSGKGWTIGIDTPTDGNIVPGQQTSGSFTLEPEREYGVVTSGNYRKYYIIDSVKYSHTIDPRSGYPVRHNLLSATVIAPTSLLADALATYCMVIGFDQARDFIESRPDLEACLISSDQIWYSSGMVSLLSRL